MHPPRIQPSINFKMELSVRSYLGSVSESTATQPKPWLKILLVIPWWPANKSRKTLRLWDFEFLRASLKSLMRSSLPLRLLILPCLHCLMKFSKDLCKRRVTWEFHLVGLWQTSPSLASLVDLWALLGRIEPRRDSLCWVRVATWLPWHTSSEMNLLTTSLSFWPPREVAVMPECRGWLLRGAEHRVTGLALPSPTLWSSGWIVAPKVDEDLPKVVRQDFSPLWFWPTKVPSTGLSPRGWIRRTRLSSQEFSALAGEGEWPKTDMHWSLKVVVVSAAQPSNCWSRQGACKSQIE